MCSSDLDPVQVEVAEKFTQTIHTESKVFVVRDFNRCGCNVNSNPTDTADKHMGGEIICDSSEIEMSEAIENSPHQNGREPEQKEKSREG